VNAISSLPHPVHHGPLLPSLQKIYASDSPGEMVLNVLSAAAEMTQIDSEFVEEQEPDENDETPTEAEASNIRKAVRMMAQEFKKKQNGR
jgi:hypothetical protein